MKRNQSSNKTKHNNNTTANGFIPNSFRFISSCIKTVSSNVRSAGVSVAGSIGGDHEEHHKDQVLWASFDKLELGPLASIKHVLLLGYSNGFQVLDVEDASSFRELVSKRDGPVTFMQMQPIPAKSEGSEGFSSSHPLLLVVASDETRSSGPIQNERNASVRDGYIDPQSGNLLNSPTAVRFYSLRSHSYVHVLRFRSTVYMFRCSPRIVAVGLAAQIYCFDALTLESKFSVLTYPVPQLGGPGVVGVNIGYGPMAVGPRWLAYASNNPLSSNTGRLSPQTLSPSPGVSPSTSPGNGTLVARYAMESSKQLANGLMNLGDKGYKTLSKYYQELRPDGSSSPVSSNSGWKVGRATSQPSETDIAGTVVIRDFESRTVISQFRAHTSPISALCFDPSGTLLVTASVHGNNINVFRIMLSQNGSGAQSYGRSYSHVHLYKLHRGMTSAVIQDICFSPYSQWVAIVSSRGTCHIFVLSPFGGETGLQIQNPHVDGPSLIPVLSSPWWFDSSLTMSQHPFPSPPPPITLSVLSRIRLGNSGWLNTVSNAASSAAGKTSIPTGTVAAIFHRSVEPRKTALPNVNALEHLLVYSPSGSVIQYELLPSLGEQGESAARIGTGQLVQTQEDEFNVKFEPIQWWDVCRRVDWPEREESVSGVSPDEQGAGAGAMAVDNFDYQNSDTEEKDSAKPLDRSHWYLSNAEVQIQSGRIPIWQKSKVYFFKMCPEEDEEKNLTEDGIGGEIEIEKISLQEVEIKRKDLLPVFDHFHSIQSNFSNERALIGGKYSTAYPTVHGSNVHGSKDKFSDDGLASHTKLISPDSLGNMKDLSRKPSDVRAVEQMNSFKYYPHIMLTPNESDDGMKGHHLMSSSPQSDQRSIRLADTSVSHGISATNISSANGSKAINAPKPGLVSAGGPISTEVLSSSSVVTSEISNTGSSRSDVSMNILDEEPVHEYVHDHLDFGQYFDEGYCKSLDRGGRTDLTGVVTDVEDNNTSPRDKDKSEDDGDSDDMLGGVFDFSEEG